MVCTDSHCLHIELGIQPTNSDVLFFQNQCIFKLRDRKIWAYLSPFGIIHAVLSRIYSLFGGGVPKFTNINYAYKE